MSYRVAVHNAFEGLDDENEDPKRRTPKPKMVLDEKAAEGPKTVKAKPEAPTGAAVAPASAAAKKPADGQRKNPAGQNPAPRRDGTTGAPRNETGDAARRNTRDFQKDRAQERSDRPPRGEGRGEGAPRRGRQFDRRSGTGRPPTENKKGGSGAGNWGNETKEGIVAAEEQAAAGNVESPAVEREGEVTSPEAKKEEPKEPEGISFDEYLAKKAAAAPKTDGLKIRSAGEGVDNKAWNSYVALQKETDAPAKKAQDGKATKESKETKEKDLAADLLNFRIARDEGDRPEGGRGRGRGRGGLSRGSRGRGAGRGDYRGGRGGAGGGSAPAFNSNDFPSLGGAPATKAQ